MPSHTTSRIQVSHDKCTMRITLTRMLKEGTNGTRGTYNIISLTGVVVQDTIKFAQHSSYKQAYCQHIFSIYHQYNGVLEKCNPDKLYCNINMRANRQKTPTNVCA